MTRKNIHVVPRGDEWAVRREGASRASKVIATQREATEAARETARRENVELIVHGEDGRIRSRDSYGNDPCPPKDKNR